MRDREGRRDLEALGDREQDGGPRLAREFLSRGECSLRVDPVDEGLHEHADVRPQVGRRWVEHLGDPGRLDVVELLDRLAVEDLLRALAQRDLEALGLLLLAREAVVVRELRGLVVARPARALHHLGDAPVGRLLSLLARALVGDVGDDRRRELEVGSAPALAGVAEQARAPRRLDEVERLALAPRLAADVLQDLEVEVGSDHGGVGEQLGGLLVDDRQLAAHQLLERDGDRLGRLLLELPQPVGRAHEDALVTR